MLTYYAIFKFHNFNDLSEEDRSALIDYIGVWRCSDADTEKRAYDAPTWVRIPASIVYDGSNIAVKLMSFGIRGRFVWVEDESFYPYQENTIENPNHKHAVTCDLY